MLFKLNKHMSLNTDYIIVLKMGQAMPDTPYKIMAGLIDGSEHTLCSFNSEKEAEKIYNKLVEQHNDKRKE